SRDARGPWAVEKFRRRGGGERRELQARQGQDARPGRRVRHGQDHAGTDGHAPARTFRRRTALPRRGRPRHAAPRLQAQGADRVPEPLRLAQSEIQHRRHADRADAPAWHRRGRGRTAHACDEAAGEGRPAGERALQVPPRILRRPAPAHRHRTRAHARARAADLRRSGVGPGRLDPGTTLESAARAARGDRDELPLHFARPGGSQVDGRRGDGDEGRRGGRNGERREDLFGAEAPLYSDAARFGSPMRFLFLLLMFTTEAWAAHAYSQFGDIKYPAGFKHFEWVNPDAPKGG